MTKPRVKRKTQKARGESADSFASFKKATSEVFEFLTKDFGFSYVATIEYRPECVIKYQNQTTGISVTYEMNSLVSLDLVKLTRTATDVTEDRSYDLSLLMEIRRPATDLHKFYGGDKEWTDEYVEKLLNEYANFLKKHARDVLTGDFSIFPELKKLSAHYWRQKNKEYFGTYCGESPRFSKRPTLKQVFAGTKEDKTFRIYEAHWDHQYSTKEIAGFLNVTEKAIKQALSDFDDLG